MSFLPDDYHETTEKYFREIRLRGEYAADPSGWLNVVMGGAELLEEIAIHANGLPRYYSDESQDVSAFKIPILSLVSEWDKYEYSYDELTLCHSVTVGSAIVLSALKKLGIKSILFETPLYFAALAQSRSFAIPHILVPTYLSEGFDLHRLDNLIQEAQRPYVVWVFQPKMGIGMNQGLNTVKRILERISEDSFLIIDEATEQSWPSHLNEIQVTSPKVIKIRSLTKGIGINGLRCACITHHKSLRASMVSAMENFQGGLDYQSLNVMMQLANRQDLFKQLLNASRHQVESLCKKAQHMVAGLPMKISQMDNGYIGSVAMRRPSTLDADISLRTYLLEYCTRNLCPIVLGSTMYFAIDPEHEFVRLTYYNEEGHIIEGLRILSQVYEA